MPFGFTGEQADANELVYLRARYLNPAVGTFVRLDPFEGIVQRPMSLNGYGWVEGNPVMNVDPSGMRTNLAALVNAYSCNANFVLNIQPVDQDLCWCYCDPSFSRYDSSMCNYCRGFAAGYYIYSDGHSFNFCEPQPPCEIEIASFEVALGGHHALLVFTDASGEEHQYKGGPANGKVVAEELSFKGSEAEAILATNGNRRYLVVAGVSTCNLKACLGSEVERINGLNAMYDPVFGPNSNSVIRTMLEKCVGVVTQPPDAPFVTGWEDLM